MEKQLVRVKFGSHLYGCNTPTSDTYYKSIHVPPADDIIMMETPQVVSRSTGSQSVKNTADDIDDESYTIAKFFDMLQKGDMVAGELLFTDGRTEYESDTWKSVILPNRHKFIARDIRGFVSYCMRQSAKYGVKGSRVSTMRNATEMFSFWIEQYGANTKIKDVPDFEHFFDIFVQMNDHCALIDLPVTRGSTETARFLSCCDRKVGFTVALKDAHSIYKKVFDEYGARALSAEQNQGVDWKAMYHAIRVSEQAQELLTDGRITFPRKNASELLSIKRGEHSFQEIGAMLENNLDNLLKLMVTSDLPDKVDSKLMDEIIHDLHLDKITEDYGLHKNEWCH
jgi:hypothetical protein